MTYFNRRMPVFVHAEGDIATFRMITAQFCINGNAKQAMVRPTHSQSPSWIAALRCDNAARGTLSTTSAFFVPMSMEWSMMATQG